MSWVRRLTTTALSDDPLIRSMSYQSVLSAFAEGAFLTGEAVFFTQVVGLSPAQVGLMLTVAMGAEFALAVPLGRLTDRVGSKRTWVWGSLLQAALFAAWILADGFASALAIVTALGLAASWSRAGRNAYRIDVFPRETRVRGQAYMRAARNVGYTLGAGFSGIALAFDDLRLVHAIPLFTAALLVVNTYWITRLPELRTPAREHAQALAEAAGHATERRSALHNRGFVAMSFFDGVLGTHQVLLNVVIPLWLVAETDAPKVLLAWLFGTNTVLAVLLQVAAARGVETVADSLRAQRRGALCFLVSCGIVMVTHDTVGWLTIVLVWVGHVTVTGAELFQSAGEWGLVAELSDPERRGEYQGVLALGTTLGTVWAPALYTFLAMSWGPPGWLVIAALVVVAAVGIHPATRAAERHLARVEVSAAG